MAAAVPMLHVASAAAVASVAAPVLLWLQFVFSVAFEPMACITCVSWRLRKRNALNNKLAIKQFDCLELSMGNAPSDMTR